MFPSKTPLLYVLHLIVIGLVILVTLLMTKNPLAVLGLYFIPSFPVLPPSLAETNESEEEPAMGFMAQM